MRRIRVVMGRLLLWSSVALAVAAVTGASPEASATSIRRMSLDELISNSALITRATATLVDPTAFDSATGEAYTHVILQVKEILDGNWSSSTLEFFLRGGVKPNGKIEEWSGLPKLVQGETYLLFIRAGAYHVTPFTNWAFGVYREVTLGGKTVLVTDDGRGILNLNEGGLQIGDAITESSAQIQARRMGWGRQRVNASNGVQAAPASAAAQAAMAAQCMSAKDVASELGSRIVEVTASRPQAPAAAPAAAPVIFSKPQPIAASKG